MTSQHDKENWWRLRFSVRTLLLFVLFASVSVTFCVRLHRDWYVPRTPLKWTDYSPSRIAKLRQSGKRVVILACSDATLTGSFEMMRGLIDTPLLRRTVFDRQAEVVRANPSSYRADLERLAGRSLYYPVVIVIPADGNHVQVLNGLVTDRDVVDALNAKRDEQPR